jgi:hypothetical protein
VAFELESSPGSRRYAEVVVMKLRLPLALAVALVVHAVPVLASEGNGLTVKGDEFQWPRWQGRLSMSSASPASTRTFGPANPGLSGLTLMGDYYLTGSLLGAKRAGGLRATSGVVIGPRSLAAANLGAGSAGNGFNVDRRVTGQATNVLPGDSSVDAPTLPYVGIGYTGLSPRGGWSFNADVGVVSLSPGNAAKLGRFFGGGQSLDDAVRDMRWSPVLQLGVSYSF